MTKDELIDEMIGFRGDIKLLIRTPWGDMLLTSVQYRRDELTGDGVFVLVPSTEDNNEQR